MNNNNRNNRNDRNDNRRNRNENVEFGTIGSGMSQQAKASSQAAAQQYKNQAQSLNQTNKQFTNEFAQGTGSIAQQGYNAMSQEAKARSNAAKQQYKNAQATEFGMGTGNMSQEARLNSQETAKVLKKSNLPNNKSK